jgi:hypothetical protein
MRWQKLQSDEIPPHAAKSSRRKAGFVGISAAQVFLFYFLDNISIR